MIDLGSPAPATPAQLKRDQARLQRAMLLAMAFMTLLALCWWGERQFGIDTEGFALRPRDPQFLLGVLTAPLLHGSIEHLLGNSFGVALLGTLVLYRYPASARIALPLIWLLAGLGTWIIGRPSLHIGASGITHGLMFFVFFSGLIRRDRAAIGAALLSFAFFGGMLLTILPREPGVSWEYHLSGALAGLLAAVVLRRRDPAPARRKYSWEIEEELERARAEAAQEFEPPAPDQIQPIWDGPGSRPDPRQDPRRGVVLRFPVARRDD